MGLEMDSRRRGNGSFDSSREAADMTAFTEQATIAIQQAGERARRQGRTCIETGDLLVGIWKQEQCAGRALLERAGCGEEPRPVSSEPEPLGSLSLLSRDCEAAIKAAAAAAVGPVATHHMLEGLVYEQTTWASRWLAEHGLRWGDDSILELSDPPLGKAPPRPKTLLGQTAILTLMMLFMFYAIDGSWSPFTVALSVGYALLVGLYRWRAQRKASRAPVATRCAKCGWSHAHPLALTLRAGKSVCRPCEGKLERRALMVQLLVFALYLACAGALTWRTTANATLGLAAVFWLAVFTPVAVILHEAGHLLAAWLLKMKPYEVRLGNGKLLAKRQMGGVTYRCHGMPNSGWVKVMPEKAERWRYFVLFGAGALANLTCLGVVLAITGVPTLEERAPLTLGWVSAHGLMALVALFPYSTVMAGQRVSSDGKQMLETLVSSRSNLEVREADRVGLLAQTALLDQDYPGALTYLDAASARVGSKPTDLVTRAAVLILLRRYADAGEVARTLSDQVPTERFTRASVLYTIALSHLTLGRHLREAELLIRESLELIPRSGRYQGVLGALLFVQGRDEEALKALEVALPRQSEALGVAIYGFLLAELWNSKGENQKATDARELAERCDPKGHARALADDILATRREGVRG